jgi:ERCC4-related helicase
VRATAVTEIQRVTHTQRKRETETVCMVQKSDVKGAKWEESERESERVIAVPI